MTSETKHTPGKWKHVAAIVENSPNRRMVAVDGWGGRNVADCGDDCPEAEANARRIIACVNACDGLTDEQVSQLGHLIAQCAEIGYYTIQG
jgi:hypothetical protein